MVCYKVRDFEQSIHNETLGLDFDELLILKEGKSCYYALVCAWLTVQLACYVPQKKKCIL